MKILSMSNLIPEQICDTVRFFGYGSRQQISHYCGYAAEFISRVREDDGVDGAVFPRTCDSSRVLSGYIGRIDKFLYQFPVPIRSGCAATAYLAESIRAYKKAVEAYYGVTLSDTAERAGLINARNQALAVLYEHLPELSYGAYLESSHALLQRPLREQSVPEDLPASPCPAGPKVFVVGSTQTGAKLVRQIEAAGMNIVGDRLPESRRMIFAPAVSAQGDIYENIAKSLLAGSPSPTADAFAQILQEDRDELIKKQAQGVIFLTQKYCEPYDYLFPAYKRMLDGLGIPVLRVTQTGSGAENAALAIETFADLL